MTNDPLVSFWLWFELYQLLITAILLLDNKTLKPGGKIIASVNVTNTGKSYWKRNGAIIHSRYGWKHYTACKRIERISTNYFKARRNTRKVSFTISVDDLKFYNNDLKYVYEPGDFKVFIGTNSRDVKEADFKLLP